MSRTVLVTRAPHQAGELTSWLQRRGLEVLHFPAIRIRHQQLSVKLEHFDWIVFTSTNAVQAVFNGTPVSLPATTRIAAIGEATANALAQHNCATDLRPLEATGEALVDALGRAAHPGQSIFVPISSKASAAKWQRLREQGILVDVVTAYTNECESEHTPEQLQAVSQAEMVLFASPSAFDCFLQSVGHDGLAPLEIAAIGPVTGAAIEASGYHVDVMAPQSTARAFAEAVAAHLLQTGSTPHESGSI